MAQHDWRREPLGDLIGEHFDDVNAGVGYAKALTKWNRIREVLQPTGPADRQAIETLRRDETKFESLLSISQYNSFRILHEWWIGSSQEDALSQAAQNAIKKAADPREADSQNLNDYREDARLSESTYHKELFLLFQLEFVFETRILQTKDDGTFLGFVQAQREKCVRFAALQRISHSFFAPTHRENAHVAAGSHGDDTENMKAMNPLPHLLRQSIGACVESCSWLKIREAANRRPYYLWDVVRRRTVVVDEKMEDLQYICVSHTWGRWREWEKPMVAIAGVGWPVPQNTKFEVATLPDQLYAAFQTGYVWFDLLCIPQDRSERALIEISRQAIIFGNAMSVVAWLNDAGSWDGLRSVVEWLALFYLHTSTAVKGAYYDLPELPDPNNDSKLTPIELCLWNSDNESEGDDEDGILSDDLLPVPWFTSLWTLQEACLRPDMILCNRDWMPLTAGPDTIVTLDGIVGLNNYIERGTYKFSTIITEVTKKNFESLGRETLPPEVEDLAKLMTRTCMSDLNWLSPSAIFTFGQMRQCSQSRAEAIMSVIGATGWFEEYVKEHGTAPPEGDQVLGYYPASFLNEATSKLGPTFYTSIQTDLGYIDEAVNLEAGEWESRESPCAVGSLLPFTRSWTNLVPPQEYAFAAHNHPAVKSWEIQTDGSVRITQAGILTFGDEELVEKDDEDMILAPAPDADGKLTYDTEIDEQYGDLEEWLQTFASPNSAPNFAVCLYQQIYLSRDMPGPQVGLLLKQIPNTGAQTMLVKVGQYFTRASRAWDITTKTVDWVVL